MIYFTRKAIAVYFGAQGAYLVDEQREVAARSMREGGRQREALRHGGAEKESSKAAGRGAGWGAQQHAIAAALDFEISAEGQRITQRRATAFLFVFVKRDFCLYL